MRTGKRVKRRAGVVVAVAAAMAGRADATDRAWTAAGGGSWATAANWSPAGVPAAGDAVEIPAPATGTRTVTYDYAGPAVALGSLLLDGPGTGANPPTLGETLAVPAGTLTIAGQADVGRGTRGTVAQSGGVVVIGTAGATGEALDLGYSDGYGIGTYQLSGGSLTVNGQELAGEFATGVFNQSGGTHVVNGTLKVGADVGAGTVTLTGGTTRVTSVAVGTLSPSSAGQYGTVTVAGSAQLNVSGGLVVYPSAGSGPGNTVVLAGGSILASGLTVNAPAQFNWSTGSLTLTGQAFVAGTEVRTGGGLPTAVPTLGPGQTLTVASNPANPAVGSATEFVGYDGVGTFAQTGGANAANALRVGFASGGTSQYNLSGGTLTVGIGGTVVGSNAPAAFTQTGGTHTTRSLTVGSTSGATAPGTYTLAGGTLSAASVTVSTVGTFNQTGGSLTGTAGFLNAGRTSLAGPQQWPAGATFNNAGGTATFAADAGAAAATLSLVVGSGTVTLAATQHLAGVSVGSAGVVTVDGPAGTAVVTPSLTLAGSAGAWAGRLDLSNGGVADVPGGSLSTLTSQAAQGFAGGRWNAAGGIVSATAAADAKHLTGVGVLLNATAAGSPLYTTFAGQPVGATDVLVRDTDYGDADLNGVVNAADYVRLDAGFLGHATGWQNGDFNYDGVVDGSDYTLADNAFDHQAGGTAAPAAALATAAVPEPSSLIAAAAAVAAILAGRRGGRRRGPAAGT